MELKIEQLDPNPKKFEIKNKFIVIEGIDGCGKTTLSKQLGGVIMAKTGDNSIRVHQPGFTKTGGFIRTYLKDSETDIHPRTRHMLLEAARVDLLLQMEKLRKAQPNTWIICDRHQDSSWAYQGAEGVPESQIHDVQRSYDDLMGPDLIIFLDIDPGMAIGRLWGSRLKSGMDNYDTAPIEFFEQCRQRYYERIDRFRKYYLVVDANQSEEDVLNFVTNNLKF